MASPRETVLRDARAAIEAGGDTIGHSKLLTLVRKHRRNDVGAWTLAVVLAAGAPASAREATNPRSGRELARGFRRRVPRWEPRTGSGQPHYNT